MKILKVHIKNLNSLRGEWTIDFGTPPLSQAGIFAITGPTGAGKTTVLDAITLALYGALARSKEVKEVLSYGATECLAEVAFAVGAERYLASWRLYRARGKQDGNLIGPKRELARWDAKKETFEIIAEKIREVDEAIEAISGLDYHRFTRSVLLSQGDFAAFLKADERERSELLERITGTEIYSELSKAAFARAKEEQQRLNQLQEQLHNLGLLSEEPLDPEQLARLRTQTVAAQKDLEDTRSKLQAAQRYQEALARLAQLESTAASLQARQQAFAPDQTRLTANQALRPQFALLDQWQRTEESLHAHQQAIALLRTQQDELANTLAVREAIRRQARVQLQEVQAQTAVQRTQLERAAVLTEALEQATRQQVERQQLAEKLQQQCNSQQAELDSTQASLQQLRQAEDELAKWLATHAADATLAQRLPAIEEQREHLAAIYREREKHLAEEQDLQQAYDEHQRRVQELQTQLAQHRKDMAQQLRHLREALPARFDLSRDEAAERLRAEIRQLEQRTQQLAQLQELDAHYRQLLTEQEEQQSRLASLLVDQEQLTKAILNKIEEQDAYRPILAYKQQVYQQQQLIANYAKDRQKLRAGEPCPLCGSTEHPYHEGLQPLEDQALADYQAAQAYFESLQREERQLLQRENEIAQEIQLLRGQDLEVLSGRLAEQQGRLEAFEAKIAGLLRPGDDWSVEVGSELLESHLRQVRSRLDQWRKAEQEVTTLNKQLQAQELQEQKLEKELSAAQARLEAQQTARTRLKAQVGELETRYGQAVQRLNKQLKPLGHQFDLATAEQVFADLRARAQTYSSQQEKYTTISQDIKFLSTKVKQLQPQLEQARQDWQMQAAQLAQKEAQVKDMQEQLKKLLGSHSLEDVRIQVDTALRQAESALQQAEAEWHEVQNKLSTKVELLKDKHSTLTHLEATLTDLQARLLPALQALSYETITAAQAQRLSGAEEAALQAEAEAIRLALAEYETAYQAALAQRQQWQAAADVDIEQLQAQLKEQEEAHRQLLRQLGQLEEKQAQAERRARQHASLLEAIEQQRQSFNRWAQLNELIGQADGKKFRTFAQGLTLQKLVALANVHLERLNGRYLIDKRPEADLELDIIDTFQADNRRSMYTLSGGESFLVSLALALGLSDLAGKRAQIHSLFIDEGFGTLDEHSLDLALDTLENLQSSGKTIGVISHVKALKERIGVQIQIQKHSNGFSVLKVV